MHGITLNPYYSYLLILAFPIIFYGLKNSIIQKEFYLFTIFTLLFFEGSFDIIGFSASINRLMRDFLICSYFIGILILNVSRFRFIFYKPILILFLISIISFILNQNSWIELILFYRRIFIPIFFFWIIFNIKIDINSKSIKYIWYIFLFQIIAAIYKLIIIGINEAYIGTISLRGGSLTVAYTIIGSILCFSFYLYSQKKEYLLLILAFIFFSIMGGKRAIIFFLPIVLLFMLFIYQKSISIISVSYKSTIKIILAIIPIIVLSFLVIVKINPTLNPEKKVWGKFDIKYLITYVIAYNSQEIEGLPPGWGRLAAPQLVYNIMIERGNLLLGFGPGNIIASSLTVKSESGDEDVIRDKYGIGYGARTGTMWIMFQLGIIGVIVYYMFYYLIFRKLLFYLKKAKIRNHLIILSNALCLIIYFVIDFTTYSTTFVLSNAFTYLFWFSIAIALKQINYKSPRN